MPRWINYIPVPEVYLDPSFAINAEHTIHVIKDILDRHDVEYLERDSKPKLVQLFNERIRDLGRMPSGGYSVVSQGTRRQTALRAALNEQSTEFNEGGTSSQTRPATVNQNSSDSTHHGSHTSGNTEHRAQEGEIAESLVRDPTVSSISESLADLRLIPVNQSSSDSTHDGSYTSGSTEYRPQEHEITETSIQDTTESSLIEGLAALQLITVNENSSRSTHNRSPIGENTKYRVQKRKNAKSSIQKPTATGPGRKFWIHYNNLRTTYNITAKKNWLLKHDLAEHNATIQENSRLKHDLAEHNATIQENSRLKHDLAEHNATIQENSRLKQAREHNATTEKNSRRKNVKSSIQKPAKPRRPRSWSARYKSLRITYGITTEENSWLKQALVEHDAEIAHLKSHIEYFNGEFLRLEVEVRENSGKFNMLINHDEVDEDL